MTTILTQQTAAGIIVMLAIAGVYNGLRWYLAARKEAILEQDLTDSQRLIDSLSAKIAELEGMAHADGKDKIRISLPTDIAIICKMIGDRYAKLPANKKTRSNAELLDFVTRACESAGDSLEMIKTGFISGSDGFEDCLKVAVSALLLVKNFNELEVNNAK